MITNKTKTAVSDIENESYGLQAFENLPDGATKAKQIAALNADKNWQYQHNCTVEGMFDRLIRDLEG